MKVLLVENHLFTASYSINIVFNFYEYSEPLDKNKLQWKEWKNALEPKKMQTGIRCLIDPWRKDGIIC